MGATCQISGCSRSRHSVSMRLCELHTDAAWRRGQLARKLHPIQRRMRDAFYASTATETVWNCARRLGKTFLLVVLAFECCLRKERQRVAFGASQSNDVEEIIQPMIEQLLEDCPEDLLPTSRWAKHRIEFSNGSVIRISGLDKGRYKYLRGRGLDLGLVDEAGFVDGLRSVVDSVLWPQTWTTGGRLLLASTPPETVGHHFQTRYLLAKSRGASEHFTFFDNPLLEGRHASLIAEAAAKSGAAAEEYEKSTEWLREGLAEFVTDTERAVLPAYTEARERLAVVEQTNRPLWVDRYVALDLGPTRDWTAVLFAYFDFARQKLVVLREKKLIRPTTEQIRDAIEEAESEVYPANPMPETALFRYADANDILLRDLANDGLLVEQTLKDNRDAQIQAVNSWVAAGKIEIDPSCRHLTSQMRAAIWNKRHTEFERIEGFGHFDFVAALIYLVRNVLPNVNRLPHHYGKSPQTHWLGEAPQTDEEQALEEFLS